MNKIMIPQINELCKYKPDYWWFDGEWEIKTKIAKQTISNIVRHLRKTSIVNSRVADNNFDIKIFGDRKYPDKLPTFNWEYIFTIAHSWGYNLKHEDKDYINGKEMYELYKKAQNMNGNFLINFGPKMDGTLDNRELKSYKDFLNYL
jgi:alpha-L-fucosidase